MEVPKTKSGWNMGRPSQRPGEPSDRALYQPTSDLTVAMPMDGGAAAIQILSELQDQAMRDGDAKAKWLKQRPADLQAPSELRRLDESFGVLNGKVVKQARCADLFIATRPYGEAKSAVWPDLVEAVLFGSGRAMLLVPPGQHRQGPFETVLVAWNGSRESARALREGLEFIEQAARTVVLVVDPPTDGMPCADLKAHLAHHNVIAEVVTATARIVPLPRSSTTRRAAFPRISSSWEPMATPV